MTALTVLSTLVFALSIGVLDYSLKEMRHERLTYSQWYEGSVNSVYSSVMLVIVAFSLCAAAWFFLFHKKKQGKDKSARRRVSLIFLLVFGLMSALFVVVAVGKYRELEMARERVEEVLLYYIHQFGKYRLLSLLSIEGAVVSLVSFLTERKQNLRGKD